MRRSWIDAVCSLGGTAEVAETAAVELAARYAESHRRYHNTAHVLAVLRDSALLAADLGLAERDRAVITLAACAHDVCYDGRPGDDERHSAEWAGTWLRRAGIADADVSEVEGLVLATLDHSASAADLAAQVLFDADLAILGASVPDYQRYHLAVRTEYASVPEDAWRTGRVAVLTDLAAREPLFHTTPARHRWERQAKANLATELASLVTPE
ncbi:MAG TPA: HD domain-containing protein [Pseudonocardiaceae bacterium]|jgi:predicted metal-dependent HD superfamily phosphohydrolase|nr:HD domain-containing protein [Pseudonocardiaceae bacterium]